MGAYSMDLRRRVIQAREAGDETAEIAERYRVSVSWVNDLWKRYQETGSFAPKQVGGYRKLILENRAVDISEAIERTPDLTAKELKDQLRLAGSIPTINRMLNRLGYSFKKNSSSFRTRSS